MGQSCEMGKLCDSFHWLHCNLKTCDITEHVRVHLLQTTESRQRRNGKQEGELACLLPLIYRWFFSPTVRTILTFSTPVTQAAANSHQITWTKRVCEHYISPVTGVHTSWERVFFGVAAITTYVFFCTGILKKIIDFVYTANFCTSSTFNLPAGEVGTLVIASLLDTEGRMHKPKFQWIVKLWIKSKTSPL